MDIGSVEESLNHLFKAKISRTMVFWFDEDQDFIDEVDDINLEGVKVYHLSEDNWIESKYLFEISEPDTNFLVYAPFKQPEDKVNFFADMVHYGEVFTADKFVLICRELNIPLKFRDVVAKYSKFWNSKQRIQAFKDLGVNITTELDIILNILCVLTNVKYASINEVVTHVLIGNLEEENKYIVQFNKMNILDDFWRICDNYYGYNEKHPSVRKFLITLLITYTDNKFKGNTPNAWLKFISSKSNDATIFVNSFMKNNDYSTDYDKLSYIVSKKIKLESTIKNKNIDDVFECDSFEEFDKLIINHSIELLVSNMVELPYYDSLKSRETTHFYKKFKPGYELIKWANLIIKEIPYLKDLSEPDTAEEMIDEYVNHWSLIDKYYRKFINNFDKIHSKTENMEKLNQLIENIYTNTFLETINPWWTNKLSELESLKDINIDKEYNFYKNNIPGNLRKHKICVIISDALRYNIGAELKEELDKNPKRKTSIKPLMGVIPSYTSLGMASLLPHKTITYNENNVLIDDLKTQSTEDRNKILNNYTNNALAISYKELKTLKQSDLKELFNNVQLVYIYYNRIDATGDKSTTENRVFEEADNTIIELRDMIKKLTNNVGFTNFYVTADHGFIYQRSTLDESDKIDLTHINSIIKNKRFILTNEKLEIPSTHTFSLDYIGLNDLYVTVPLGVDIFKAPGSGINYVHGGAAIQECITPLLTVKSKTGSVNQDYVDLNIVSVKKRLTNHDTYLTFIQSENVSNTVLPVEVRLYFIDNEGKKISNEVLIKADRNTENSEDREFREKFSLISSNEYYKDETYYLIMENVENDVEMKRYEFTIDLAFSDGFEF